MRRTHPPGNDPISRLFRNLLGPGEPSAPSSDTEDSDSPALDRHRPRDVIDGRIPHSASQGKHLEQAEELLAGGHWEQALELVEIVLADPEHATVRAADGRPVMAVWEANRILARLPANGLQTYRLRHEAQAKQLYREARQTGNWDQVIDVATRFFHTETGQEAANSIGDFHFDRGEFGLASLWFVRLLESGNPLSHDPKWRLKVAWALREAGNRAASDELLRGLQKNGEAPVDIGGDSIKPDTWLHRLGDVEPGQPVLSEWRQFLGSSSRTGTASGGEPLLLPRWFHAVTQNKLIGDQIQALGQDLSDSGRALIPSLFPLMVKDRIAVRTLHGVHVLDASTGRLLWETQSEIPEDELSASHPAAQFDFEDRFAFRRFGRPWRTEFFGGDGSDGHPLTGLLYRDANFGLLSSDGKSLFVLEDPALIMHGMAGTGFQLVGDRFESPRRATAGNRLTAYDLESGRERWSIGGPANGESFDLPLAGHFFFGAPLVDGGDLFLVAEHDLDIRLFALDPDSGHVRWSQLLAHSDGRIEQDLGRRWWTAQVAYSAGILVCPTTVGWLVGVNRLDHSVLWMYRYAAPRPGSDRREHEQGDSLVMPSELNQQWCASAPVIVGNRVIDTPDEEPAMVCLDLSSGTARWRYPKGEEQLYLAGADAEHVIVVGKSTVTALSLDSGAVQWATPYDESEGSPSGRGIIASGKFYLPLRNGALWALDLATGRVLERTQLPSGSKPLGNLAMYRGLVLSQSAWGLTAFEQREAIQSRIAARQAADPHDEWASIKSAQIALLHDDPSAALASLDRATASRLDPQLASPYRSALIEALSTSIRRDYKNADSALSRLAQAAQTGDERLLLSRLRVEQALAEGNFGRAFEELRELSIGDRGGLTLPRPDDPQVSVDFDAWVAGRLVDTWAAMPKADRARFDLVLDGEADRVLRMGRLFQERFVRLYGFHPASRRVVDRLADDLASAGDFVPAERLLLRQTRAADPNVAAGAQLRLARLWDDAGMTEDADAAYRELARAFPGVPVEKGVTGEALVKARWAAGLLDGSPARGPDWGDIDLKVYRFGSNYFSQHVEDLVLGQQQTPFFRDHRFAVDERHQRLEIVRASDDRQHWLLPLRGSSHARQGEYTVAVPAGHGLVVLHRDVLHYLAPVERRVLWTRPLDVPNGFGNEYRVPHPLTPRPLRGGTQFTSFYSLLSRSTERGMLAAANAEYVCLYGRREIVVLDSQTGDALWKCTNVPARATVFGTDDAVFVVPPDRSQAMAYRATDGKKLQAEKLGDLLVNAIAVSPAGIVTVDGLSSGILGIEAPHTTVRLVDPISRTESWKVEYPGGTLLALLDDMQLLAVSASGEIERVDFATGEITKFESRYPAAALRSRGDVYAVADRDQVYLFAGLHRHALQFSDGFRSVPVGGLMVAYDARTGKQLWKRPEKGTAYNLVLDFFRASPVLTLEARVAVASHFGHSNLHLLVLDKRTGRAVLEATDPSSSVYRTLELNRAERYIELRSYNLRLRMMAVDRPPQAKNESAPADLRRTGNSRADAGQGVSGGER